MRPILLNGPRPADPAWFNRVRHGRHQAIVDATGQLQLDGEHLRFADQGEVLPTGTACVVWLESNFVCLPAAYLEAEAAIQREREAERAAEHIQRLNQQRVEAEAFNATIALPVAWNTGFKAVLSGLRERSWGDGTNSRTVVHILLKEDLHVGRLHREVGDFLCSARAHGKRWIAPEAIWSTDGHGQHYAPQVTCRACLTVTEKLKEKQN